MSSRGYEIRAAKLSDSGERARLELRHSVLRVDRTEDEPNATLSLPKDRFLALAAGGTTWDALQKDDAVEVAGDPEVLTRFFASFDLNRHRCSFTSGSAAPDRKRPAPGAIQTDERADSPGGREVPHSQRT
jgi:hypothetical protein